MIVMINGTAGSMMAAFGGYTFHRPMRAGLATQHPIVSMRSVLVFALALLRPYIDTISHSKNFDIGTAARYLVGTSSVLVFGTRSHNIRDLSVIVSQCCGDVNEF
jgi:hypothetical protein